ncbi:hypothetical protein L6164_002171 [Bauhinia variegata]|uniref:Uncharacterized protein n=1 Tax=Bauhinia variegata TaxID=167791 RepID=A0ACB9Q044_BAUVA|nr:hypothetical protein L6164_002171 [Bauhinia variegata]
MVESKEWYLAAYATEGIPTSDHLKLRTVVVDIDSIPDGHVALETLFISVEPYLRTRLTGLQDGISLHQFQLNQVITGFGAGRVIRSNDSNYKEGDEVLNPFSPVVEYCVTPSRFLRKLDPTNGILLLDYFNALGPPGFAAWLGIEVLGDPKPGSNVFISAASSAVGLCAGQLAKIRGCRAIGSTCTDEKVKLIKEKFGYDDGFNYDKETDLDAALSKYFPNGIDVHLDNVGGKMLEAVLNHVWTEREGVRNLLNMVGKEVKMEGFMISSYLDRFGDFAKQMESYLKDGKIKSKNKINFGIDSLLDSLASLFSSTNIGNVVIQVKV